MSMESKIMTKLKFTDEQWLAMLPGISEVDGGCDSCITFLVRDWYDIFDITEDQLNLLKKECNLESDDIERIKKGTK